MIGECGPLPRVNKTKSIRDCDWHSAAQLLDKVSGNNLGRACDIIQDGDGFGAHLERMFDGRC